MKKITLILFLCLGFLRCFSQELNLNKAETVALLAEEFQKANGLLIKDEDGDLRLQHSNITFEKGILTITQSLVKDNVNQYSNTYKFNPYFIESIGNASNDNEVNKNNNVGGIRIFVEKNKVQTKSVSASDNEEKIYYHNSWITLYTNYNDGKGFDVLKSGLLHLKKLLEKESDPFALSTDEKRLAELFGKYKTCETSERPNGEFKGSKISVTDMELTLFGPSALYTSTQTKTLVERQNTTKITTSGEFWWRNVNELKYQVVAGGLFIRTTEKAMEIKYLNLLNNSTNRGSYGSLFVFFKPASADTNGQAKKDVLEIIELIKKIVKYYGGGEVSIEINEK